MNDLKRITDERRVGTTDSANTLYTRMKTLNDKREQGFALIENQINGGRPYDPQKLADQGQSWRANFNFGDAASALEQAQVSYWRLLHDTSNYLNLQIHSEDPNKGRWGQTMVHNFNRFIEDWGDDYVVNYLSFSRNHLMNGVGPVLFPDADSPRWEAIRTSDVLVPERAKASSGAQDTVCLRQELLVSELWEKIRTEDARKNSTLRGWKVEEIRKILYAHLNSGNAPQHEQDLVKMEDSIRNRSTELSEGKEGSIDVVNILVKEWDGKVTKVMFSEKHHALGFIFDDHGTAFRSESMSDAIGFVFFEVGNGMFHSVRGFGYKNFQTSIAMNRLKCRALDRATIEGLNFKDTSEGTRQTLPVLNMGPINILPKDLEQVPNYPGSSSIGGALGMLQDTVNWNNARYRDQSQQIEQSSTATQARILANLQSQVEVSNATLYLKQFARNIMAKQLERLRRKGNSDPDAKLFRERCLENGAIPEEAFHNAEVTVGTGADPGKTSAALQAEIAYQLLQLQGNRFVNQRAAIEAYVEGTTGAQSVSRFILPEDSMEDKSAINHAQIENTSLGDGLPIEVSEAHNHAVHAQVHMEPLKAIIGTAQTIEEGQVGTPANSGMPTQPSLSQEQMIALETALPHIAQHLEYLSLDKYQGAVFQQLQAEFKALASVASGMINKIQETALAFANQPMLEVEDGGIPPDLNNAQAQEPFTPQAPDPGVDPTQP